MSGVAVADGAGWPAWPGEAAPVAPAGAVGPAGEDEADDLAVAGDPWPEPGAAGLNTARPRPASTRTMTAKAIFRCADVRSMAVCYFLRLIGRSQNGAGASCRSAPWVSSACWAPDWPRWAPRAAASPCGSWRPADGTGPGPAWRVGPDPAAQAGGDADGRSAPDPAAQAGGGPDGRSAPAPVAQAGGDADARSAPDPAAQAGGDPDGRAPAAPPGQAGAGAG